MSMRRMLPWALVLLLTACASGAPGAGPLAIPRGEFSDEFQLAFFAGFDERSFQALVERAFTDEEAEAREQASDLLRRIVLNWYPELQQREVLRHLSRRLLVSLLRHPDARVRTGLWRIARYLYDDPTMTGPASEAFADGVQDRDPDVRLAAVTTALALHSGHPGGCVIEAKRTAFTLRVHRERLAIRLFAEPDARVRGALLRALAWEGRDAVLPLFTRYFSEADRREELSSVGWKVLELFQVPATGQESEVARPHGDEAAAWARFKAFTASLQETRAARRNGVMLELFMASETSTSIHEDRGLLRRVIEGLERDEEGVREEDLFLIVDHWQVMDPKDVIHQPDGFLRQSSVPEILKGLRTLLASNP